jgi:hypothetical protein
MKAHGRNGRADGGGLEISAGVSSGAQNAGAHRRLTRKGVVVSLFARRRSIFFSKEKAAGTLLFPALFRSSRQAAGLKLTDSISAVRCVSSDDAFRTLREMIRHAR